MKNFKRRIILFFHGAALFKDWPLWLEQRFGILKKRGRGVFRLRNGISFALDYSTTNPGVFQEIWLMDLYEKFYKIKKEDVVVDVGAHIGAFSVFAASKGAKVYAYEPTPSSFGFLVENTAGRNVIARRLAVSGKADKIKMFEGGGSEGNSAISDLAGGHSFEVEGTTLEEIFRSNSISHCDFLKMDCEGSEISIFEGAPRSLFAKIGNIGMEYHKNLEGVRRILESSGFEVLGTEGGDFGYLYAKQKI